ncbi:hypothetical protein BN2475_440039 [Paraburkholderia ribeironis]|uniref:Uncharacterized protein n=1 Tax=Paraburkholderia ribeironis TaxID=1247936 RepID=A0A1N7S8C0_9BURK|nr:hypothetical protein BN2475_440039 [Paraburkholderia ribeironis]
MNLSQSLRFFSVSILGARRGTLLSLSRLSYIAAAICPFCRRACTYGVRIRRGQRECGVAIVSSRVSDGVGELSPELKSNAAFSCQ